MEEVVIVGAGPCGLMTAKFLVEKGIHPLVLEKNDKFGLKPCGELLGEKLFGFDINSFYSFKSVIEKRFSKSDIYIYDKKFEWNFPVFNINRKKFETDLYKELKKKGANVILNSPVKSLEFKNNHILINDKIKAKLIVGADGANSLVSKFIGNKIKNHAFAMQSVVKSKVKFTNPTFWFNEYINKGYIWCFPKKQGYNLGFGSLLSSQHPNFKKSKEFLKEIFNKDIKYKGSKIPISLPKRICFKNVVLVGDAASQVEPLTGGGLNIGIVCSHFAAESIFNNLTKNKPLNYYETFWKKNFAKVIAHNYYLSKILYSLQPHKKLTVLFIKIFKKFIKNLIDMS